MLNRISMKKFLRRIYEFFLFFFLVSFITTCTILSYAEGLDIPIEIRRTNAIFTFSNVVFLALLLWTCDYVRRKFMVDRYVKKITSNLTKITKGDFSIEIEKSNPTYVGNQFDIIIDGINKMTKELNSVETLRNDFISNVSHEFKTPLAIIQNHCTLLQDEGISIEEQKEYVQAISDTSKDLAKLITNILSLNKIENQQIFPKFNEFNLSEQLVECLLAFEDNLNEKELNIETDIDEEIYIKSDEELLKIVWNNLFSNAIKFSNFGGTILISAKVKNDEIYFSVSDNGIGMDNETGKRIFDKFYQGDTAHSVKGNGLGLALVKRIINILDGEINVKSEIGKGSKFTVYLKNGVFGSEE